MIECSSHTYVYINRIFLRMICNLKDFKMATTVSCNNSLLRHLSIVLSLAYFKPFKKLVNSVILLLTISLSLSLIVICLCGHFSSHLCNNHLWLIWKLSIKRLSLSKFTFSVATNILIFFFIKKRNRIKCHSFCLWSITFLSNLYISQFSHILYFKILEI